MLSDCSDPAIQAQIFAYADRYGIDRNVALAQIRQESGCRSTVCSNQDACGIAQFIPGTWAQYGKGSRTDINASLDAWGRLMRDLLSAFGGDYRLALAGYHSGAGAARAALNNPAGNPRTNNYVNSILGSAGSIGVTGSLPSLPMIQTPFGSINPLWIGAAILAFMILK